MYQLACGVLLTFGVLLNISDRRMLALTLLVGASIFMPVPRDTALQFYSLCIAAELLVGVLAYALHARASGLITDVCAVLVIAHMLGYALDGYPPFSPYRSIVKLLEVSQLLACVALSPLMAHLLRNRDATTT
jgi:hypothetical protein